MEVNSFWHGERLSNLEILCLSSFVKNGIGVRLWVYEPPIGLPRGVILENAADFLPRNKMFFYQPGSFNTGSVAGFSNLFRYTLIHQIGGWWIDTDYCCLQPFFFDSEEIYFQQPHRTENFSVGSALFRAPSGSPVLRHCLDRFAQKHPARMVHGQTGPRLLTEAALARQKRPLIVPPERFCPVAWWDYERLFTDETLSLEGCFAVHFYNAMIAAAGLDKNADFPVDAPFERLKRRYLSSAENE